MKKLFPNHKELSFKFSDMVSKPQAQSIQPKQQPFNFLFPKMQKMPGLSLPAFSFKSLTANKPQKSQDIRGASLQKQKEWKTFAGSDKVLSRMMLKDTDMDGTPDIYDCQPLNPLKQDKVLFPRYLKEKKNIDVQASPKIKGTIYKQFTKYPEMMKERQEVPTTITTSKTIPHFGHITTQDESDRERKIELRENTFKQKYDIDFERYVRKEHNANPQVKDLETYYTQLPDRGKFTAKNRPVRTMLHEFKHAEQIKEHGGFAPFIKRYNTEEGYATQAESQANRAAKHSIENREFKRKENKFHGEELQDFSMFEKKEQPQKVAWQETFKPQQQEFKMRDWTPEKRKVQPIRQVTFVELNKTSLHPKQQRLIINEKLHGASEFKQQEWREMPQEEKIVERIEKPDTDGDNVPDEFDCEPENPDKQDFTPSRRNEDITAAQKFGQLNINRLKKLGQGRDRVVYALDKDKVLKIARTPGGLSQNMPERDLDNMFGMLKHHETGKDYVVMEKADPPGKAVSTMFRKVKQHGGSAYADKYKLSDAFMDAGYEEIHRDISNYDYSSGDLLKRSSWGEKNGEPVLVDAGSLSADSIKLKYDPITHKTGFTRADIDDYNVVLQERKQFKNKGRELPTANEGKQTIISAREVPSQYHYGQNVMFETKPKRGRTQYNVYPKDIKIDNPKQLEIEPLDSWHIQENKEKAWEFLDKNPKRELDGASLQKQEEWKEMPQEEKIVERIEKKDTDRDGTPDEFDCEPENPDKQDTEITVGGQMLETYTPEKRKNPFQIITEDDKTIDWESMEEQVFQNGENLFRKTTSMNKEEKMADLLERANIVYPLTFGGMSKWSQNIRGTDLEGVDTPDNAPMQQEYYTQAQQAINTIPSYYLQAAQQFIQRNPSYFVGKDLNRAKRYIARALIQGQDPTFAAENISDNEDYEDY